MRRCWWQRTPTRRGRPCRGSGSAGCRRAACCACSCWASLPWARRGVWEGEAGQREGEKKKTTTQKGVEGQGEAAAGSLSYLRGPGDTAGHRQGIWSLRSRQGSRFPRFGEDLAGQRERHASGRLMLSARARAEQPPALGRTPSPVPGLNLQHPKLKPLPRTMRRPTPGSTLPSWGRHHLPQGMPKLPLRLRQWQRTGRTLHIRGLGSEGPTGTWEMVCVEKPRSSQAKRKDESWNNSCLLPSAKAVQFPRCPESSSASLHARVSASRRWDPQFNDMQDW